MVFLFEPQFCKRLIVIFYRVVRRIEDKRMWHAEHSTWLTVSAGTLHGLSLQARTLSV